MAGDVVCIERVRGLGWRMACSGVLILAVGAVQAADAPSVPLVPAPQSATVTDGTLRVNGRVPIVVTDSHASSHQAAIYLARHLLKLRGWQMHVVKLDDAPSSPVISLRQWPKAPVTHAQGYRLTVDAKGIHIQARDSAGLFYGAVSALQLLTATSGTASSVTLRGMRIDDWPRYTWRGLMVDSARHMQSVDELRKIIDQMAQAKLNIFHWHLTDDQGWRLQIKRYPKLTQIGAWRTPPNAGKHGEPRRYGGFYSQNQVRALVAYAQRRHITIVPELDMPGHAQAAIAAYPQLGVTGQRPKVSADWGINPYLYNVDDGTFTFLENVLDEVMALFPSHYIHLGGDEAIKDQWQASPKIQARIKALGLKDENALQGWFIDKLGHYLSAHGRRLVGWDEILEGGDPPKNAIVMSWRGIKGAITAAKKGHDVVLAPSPQLYLDHLQADAVDEPAGRMPVESLKTVYDFKVRPKALDATQARHVLGAQANAWTEHMPSDKHLDHAVFPRLEALAEVTWRAPSTPDFAGFLHRLEPQMARLRAQGVDVADSVYAPRLHFDRNAALASGMATVRIDTQGGVGTLRYTTDGSTPTVQSPHYRVPLKLTMPTTLRVATFAADGELLAKARTQVFDATHMRTRLSAQLPNCAGSDFQLRLQPQADARSMTPTYAVNLFAACRMYPKAALSGIDALVVDVARLPNNYALAHDAKSVVQYPSTTPHGALVVRRDRCDGPVLARQPLPDPASAPSQLHLRVSLPKTQGTHDLCLRFTAPIHGPLYGIGKITLEPGS
ncbi:family 20 glycosylhydrolase [Oleiagrimonas sp. C23AA]|uniref:beta-N-acetylhexosaminidase n=1 Tax=Oleiagrimonas sp. C23AA TaxID=2719047 RepID=UPI0014202810|nr:family 20 glycosylhydrolase [Oleiagrimonas sp. C23AA]NII10768.1 family 20 glycosylhydrolase [Oleiagrimonas sp. C23AA]